MSFRDVVKKSILFGLGAAVITKEQVEDFVKDLQKDKDLTPDEGKKVVREILAEAEKKLKKPNEAFKKSVESTVKSVMKELGVATRKDLEALKAELRKAKSSTKSAPKRTVKRK